MPENFDEKILVVLPAYNEEGKIGRVISKIPSEWIQDVVVVNDGSSDNTEKESTDAGATIINQPKNIGVGAAIRAGIKYAVE
ncbi:MAG: glycosyltransferase, partial [Candidatus Aminicenantaceae bacterium]